MPNLPLSAVDALLDAMQGDPRASFHEAVATAAAGGEVPQETLRRLQEVARLIDDTQHRAHLQQALVGAVLELGPVRAPEETGTSLVRLARRLLSADVAYLTLTDAQTQTFLVAEAEGLVGDDFRRISLPLSDAPSLVGATSGPYQCADLLSEAGPPLPAALVGPILAEGVRAILGVPVRIDGYVLGSLFVADRRVRHFVPVEVSALGSLAAQGAAAIENAQTRSALQLELDEVTVAHTRSSRQLSEFARLRDAEVRLLAALTPRGDAHNFERELGEILDAPAFTVAADASTLLLDRRQLRSAPADIEEQLVAAYANDRAVTFPVDDGHARVTLVPARVGELLLGVVGMHGEAGTSQLLIMRQAAMTYGALLASRRALELAGTRERTDVLDALLVGRAADEQPALARRARALGLDTGHDMVVVIAEPVASSVRRVHAILGDLVAGEGIVAIHHDRVRAAINATDAEALATRCARALAARGANATVAAELITAQELAGSGGLAAIPAAHDGAAAVLSTALALGRRGEPCTRAMLGIAALVISGDTSGATARVIRYTIGPLLTHDDTRGTALADTALTFLDTNQRVAETAELLHLHENTVRQRIARIDNLLGPNWRRGPRSLDTHLALRLHQLSRTDRHMI